MKYLLSLCLAFAWASVIVAEPVKWGKGKGEKLLYRIDVVRAPIAGFAQDVYVAYPRSGDLGTNEEIVDIWVYDKYPNSSGAVPVLAYGVERDISGRVEDATVILRGQRSAGINSTVEFYGRK